MVVVGSSSSSEWFAVAGGEVESGDGVAGDDEVAAVQGVVTPGAQADQQGEVGGSSAGVPDDVVDLQMRVVAAGGRADAFLACDD